MVKTCLTVLMLATAATGQPQAAASQWDPAARQAAQRAAMTKLAFLDGAWRGRAVAGPDGDALVQTERVGTILGGTLRLVEGRGYDADGNPAFNAFGVISYDPAKRGYAMRAYAMGHAGDYPLEARPDGFVWTQPVGGGATLRYTAVVKDGEWHQIGERIVGEAPPVKIFEMRLRRIGASEWPEADAVPAR